MRILLVTGGTVGRHMAGPAIRYWNLARELARRFDVALLVPGEPDLESQDFKLLVGRPVGRAFVRLARRYDVVVAQQLGAFESRTLAAGPTRTVYDLYAPFLPETLALLPAERSDPARSALRIAQLAYQVSLRCGDAFVCASERQRDYWLGALGEHGRITADHYRRDPSLRTLIDVVPFGIDVSRPVAEPRVKGVVPGIGPGDRVLVWGGGIWNWFDPLTVIRAVGSIASKRDDVKLFFPGLRHPDPTVGEMEMTRRAVELARGLGLDGRSVFFNFGWTPYDERTGYLTDADLGVSCHMEGIESHLSFRTRLLDYFWADLPVVTTEGDVLADLIRDRGLGRIVAPGDVDGWVDAVLELLDDSSARARVRKALVEVRAELSWPRVAGRLASLIENVVRGPHRRAPTDLVLPAYLVASAHGALVDPTLRRAVVQRLRPGSPRSARSRTTQGGQPPA